MSNSRPNILILYTDQQRWDALGVNGNADIKTPNLDRLARQGINFDHHFVQNPVCMPSRVSFLTGQYPATLGITHMGVPVPPDTVTLPRLLRPYGYRSANIGKLHFQPHANRDHRIPYPDYGFDHLEIADEPGPYEDAYRAWVRRKAPDQLDYVSLGLPPLAHTWREVMRLDDPVKHPVAGGGRFDFKGARPFPGADVVSRVPLIVRWPGGSVAAGRTVSQVVEAVDVVPTLLTRAAIQTPPHIQGQSLAEALAGGPFEGRGSALMEQTGWKNLRTEQYRYLIHDDGRESLWDIERDPGEYQDVSTDPAYEAILAAHRHQLLQRLVSRECPLPHIWPY
jgi:arylsulfatase A-like enzyme